MVEERKINPNIQTAEELKIEGNNLFRLKKYQEAKGKYAKIFLYINGLVSPSDSVAQYAKTNLLTDQELVQVKELKHTAYSNMAACHLSLKEYQKVIDKSKLALEIKENPKLLYRRALSYIETGDIDNAKKDLDRISELIPLSQEIEEAYKKLESKSQIILQKEKKKYKGFFDKLNSS